MSPGVRYIFFSSVFGNGGVDIRCAVVFCKIQSMLVDINR